MKVLLTGANGFVGSHVLEALLATGVATVVLLRQTSSRGFIESLLKQVEVRTGSLTEPAALRAALRDITHVIHCAGKTKALRRSEFDLVNRQGTRQVVAAINEAGPTCRRLVLMSSLAASRPAAATAPAREDEPSAPPSAYGRSKLAAEREVREHCRAEFVILRPAAVYGPRDRDFLMLFKAVRAGFCPRFDGGRQPLSLVFAKDLAQATVACLAHPAAAGKVIHVASPEVVTSGALAEQVAELLGKRPFSPSLPGAVLWPVCVLADLAARLSGQPRILGRAKYPELRAPGWVCDTSRLRDEIGFTCATSLRQGLTETLDWYRAHGWLP